MCIYKIERKTEYRARYTKLVLLSFHIFFVEKRRFHTLPSINPLFHEFFFRRSSRHSIRKALYIYWLIVATLIGNFFDDSF